MSVGVCADRATIWRHGSPAEALRPAPVSRSPVVISGALDPGGTELVDVDTYRDDGYTQDGYVHNGGRVPLFADVEGLDGGRALHSIAPGGVLRLYPGFRSVRLTNGAAVGRTPYRVGIR